MAPLPPIKAGPGYRPPAARKWLFLGVGLKFGAIWPPDVHHYTYATTGELGMAFNFGFHLKVSFKPLEYLRIHVVGDLAWAPWPMARDTDVKLHHFFRVSPGLEVTGHLPLGLSGFHSMFAGVGVLYHWMKFEHFIAGNAGFRGMVGWSLYAGRSMISVALIFDYVRARTGQVIGEGVYANDPMLLDYTGGMVSVTYHFGVI